MGIRNSLNDHPPVRALNNLKIIYIESNLYLWPPYILYSEPTLIRSYVPAEPAHANFGDSGNEMKSIL